MKTLFHIGMPKTGTSALQGALHASADYLATKGVLYPGVPNFPKSQNHRLFATQLAPLDALPRHMIRYGPEAEAHFADLHADIRAQIAARRPELLLLSAETMFRPILRDYRDKLVATFEALGPTPSFVAYLRRPSERYLSGLQQVLRASSMIRQPQPPGYRQIITGYTQLFGKNCVTVHLFHRSALRDGDVVADFTHRHLEAYGVAFEALAKVGDMNISISAEAMQVMQAFRSAFYAGRDNRFSRDSDALRVALRDADRAIGSKRPQLRPEIAEIVDYASKNPLWLRNRHGVVFPDFDYRRLEEGRLAALPDRPLALHEIVVIDPATQQAVIEHLRGSDWVTTLKRQRRRDWLSELQLDAAA